MSLVAKVFVVLNLIVSVAFLVFAMNVWTAPTKWQKMYEKEKLEAVANLAKNQKLQVELSKRVLTEEGLNKLAQNKIDNLKKDLAAVRDSELELKSKMATVENARDLKEAENEELRREYKRSSDEIIKLLAVVRKQQVAVLTERENAVKARNERSEMENELNVTKTTMAALQRDKRAIEEELALQTSRIEGLLAKGVPIWEYLGTGPEATQPVIADAQVLAVKPEVDLVMISVGSAQGVKPGFRFTVSRGAQYIGKVQVDKVYADMCSARIDRKLMNKSGLDFQVHDEAKSR